MIFWEQADSGPPQPVAVLLDSSEPMWRERPLPKEVADDGPTGAKRYEMVSTPWLKLVRHGGDDIVEENIVRAPGGHRAFLRLKPNSRGKNIRLALQQIAQKEDYLDGPDGVDKFCTVLDLALLAAPWEEVD